MLRVGDTWSLSVAVSLWMVKWFRRIMLRASFLDYEVLRCPTFGTLRGLVGPVTQSVSQSEVKAKHFTTTCSLSSSSQLQP